MSTEQIEHDYDDILTLEDYLQDHGVFVNGISGKTCHPDSWMTCVDFVRLDEAIAAANFPEEILLAAIDHWLTDANMQPPLKIVGRVWRDRLNEETKNDRLIK